MSFQTEKFPGLMGYVLNFIRSVRALALVFWFNYFVQRMNGKKYRVIRASFHCSNP